MSLLSSSYCLTRSKAAALGALAAVFLVGWSPATTHAVDWGGLTGFYHSGFEWVGGSPPAATDTARFTPANPPLPAGVFWNEQTGDTASGRFLVEAGTTQIGYNASTPGGSFTHTATTQIGSRPGIEVFNSGRLDIIASNGTFNLTTPGTVELNTNGQLSVQGRNVLTANAFDVFQGNSSAEITGPGATLNVAGATRVIGGTGASIGVANGASANLGSLQLLTGISSSSTAAFNVESGSIATINNSLAIGNDGTSPTSGRTIVNVSGDNSLLDIQGSAPLVVGSSGGSPATINVLNRSRLNVGSGGGGLIVNAGATVNLHNAVIDLDSGDLTIDGGSYVQTGSASTLGNTANATHVLNGGVFDVSNTVQTYFNGSTVRLSSGGTIRSLGAVVGNTNSPAPQVTIDGGVYDTDGGQFIVATGTVDFSSGQINAGQFTDFNRRLTHTGGTLRSSQFNVGPGRYAIQGANGNVATVQLFGDSDLGAASTFAGELAVGASGRLVIEGSHAVNADSLAILSGGELRIQGGGRYSGGDVRIFAEGPTAPIAVVDGGAALLDSSVNVAVGFTSNAGRLTLKNGGRVEANLNIFTGPLGRIEGDGVLAPGSRFFNEGVLAPGADARGIITIEGNAELFGAGSLEIGFSPSQHDQLIVTGTALLDGTLDVTRLNSFDPSVGDSFEFITAGSRLGVFSVNDLPELGGNIEYKIGYSATSVAIVAAPRLEGDFNADGVVDSADYTVWRDTLGSTTRLEADANLDLIVDVADYNIWRANFGATLVGSTVDSIPEPVSAGLMLLGLSLAFTRRQWR